MCYLPGLSSRPDQLRLSPDNAPAGSLPEWQRGHATTCWHDGQVITVLTARRSPCGLSSLPTCSDWSN
jgi:hypothetical protein